jgi:hypothetical protein
MYEVMLSMPGAEKYEAWQKRAFETLKEAEDFAERERAKGWVLWSLRGHMKAGSPEIDHFDKGV